MRRVVVLTVSLGLSFVLVYLTQFMLSTTEESFKRIVFQNTRKMQVMSFAGKTTLGIDADNMGDEEFIAAYIEKTAISSMPSDSTTTIPPAAQSLYGIPHPK